MLTTQGQGEGSIEKAEEHGGAALLVYDLRRVMVLVLGYQALFAHQHVLLLRIGALKTNPGGHGLALFALARLAVTVSRLVLATILGYLTPASGSATSSRVSQCSIQSPKSYTYFSSSPGFSPNPAKCWPAPLPPPSGSMSPKSTSRKRRPVPLRTSFQKPPR